MDTAAALLKLWALQMQLYFVTSVLALDLQHPVSSIFLFGPLCLLIGGIWGLRAKDPRLLWLGVPAIWPFLTPILLGAAALVAGSVGFFVALCLWGFAFLVLLVWTTFRAKAREPAILLGLFVLTFGVSGSLVGLAATTGV